MGGEYMNFYNKKDDLLQQVYEESEKIGLTRIEVDALFVISKYILLEMKKDTNQLEDMPWLDNTYEVFKGDRKSVLNIYHAVYSFFQVPFTHKNVPFHREFEKNPTIGHLVINIKDNILTNIT